MKGSSDKIGGYAELVSVSYSKPLTIVLCESHLSLLCAFRAEGNWNQECKNKSSSIQALVFGKAPCSWPSEVYQRCLANASDVCITLIASVYGLERLSKLLTATLPNRGYKIMYGVHNRFYTPALLHFTWVTGGDYITTSSNMFSMSVWSVPGFPCPMLISRVGPKEWKKKNSQTDASNAEHAHKHA